MTNSVRMIWDKRREAQTDFEPIPKFRFSSQFGVPSVDGWSNRLIQGDNLRVMAALRPEYSGRFALIYLDPPFFTGRDWQAQSNRGNLIPAYSDTWGNDLGTYLQWLLDRLTLVQELLAENGSLYVHLSWHSAHYVKLLLDELFGISRFQNEIIWCYREAINSKRRWNRKHDTLFFYSKGEHFTFNCDAVREPYAPTGIRKFRHQDEKGAFRLMGRGIINSPLRSKRDLPLEYESQYPGLTYRHYMGSGKLPVDYWLIDIENQMSPRRTGYPTQKPEALMERILLASSNPGDLIGDFCCGSGTTLAVAQRLGRPWIGCDEGDLAIETTCKRLSEDQTVCFSFEREEG